MISSKVSGLLSYILLSENFEEFIVLNGKVKLTLISGNIKLNELELKSPCEINIFSSNLSIQSIYKATNSLNYFEIKNSICDDDIHEFLMESETKENIKNDEKFALFKLESMEMETIDQIVKYKEYKNLPIKFSYTIEKDPVFMVNENIIDCLDINSTINNSLLFAGPKNSGKSTLVRLFSNRLLLEHNFDVYILDLDPGQSEFGLSGSISLVKLIKPLTGPPFFNKLNKSYEIIDIYFLGFISPEVSILSYFRAVEHLFLTYSSIKKDRDCHLVINTMGWTQNVGLDIMIFLITLIKPSIIYQIRSGKRELDFPDLTIDEVNNFKPKSLYLRNLNRCVNHELKIISSPVLKENISNMKPMDIRDLFALSQLLSPEFRLLKVQLFYPKNSFYYSSSLPEFNDIPCSSFIDIYNFRMEKEYQDIIIKKYVRKMVGICDIMKSPPKSVVFQTNFPYFKYSEPPICKCYGMAFVEKFEGKNPCYMYIKTNVAPEDIHGRILAFGATLRPPVSYLVSSSSNGFVKRVSVGHGYTPVSSKKRCFGINKSYQTN